jgi:hypothetical protein
MMMAELRRSKPYEFITKRALIATTTSDFTISQHDLKKAPVKPSRPGALSPGMEWMVSWISSSVKGASSSERSWGLYPRVDHKKVACIRTTVPRLFQK